MSLAFSKAFAFEHLYDKFCFVVVVVNIEKIVVAGFVAIIEQIWVVNILEQKSNPASTMCRIFRLATLKSRMHKGQTLAFLLFFLQGFNGIFIV